MAYSWRCGCWRVGLASYLAIAGTIIASFDCAKAQITPDATLGAESSVIKPNVNIKGLPSDQIDGGAIRGPNLFHSFRELNVGEGRGAYFTNPTGIENILSRVTGGSRSDVQGTLGVLGNANLFLINPNGIIFGRNASLDLSGSFLASTASSLNFADDTRFSATAPQTTPLLTVSVPIGLQFEGTVGGIRVEGDGQGTRTTTELIDTTVGLRVQPYQTLALVGSDVVLEGGTLKTGGGRIELGSIAGSGLVSLTPTNTGWNLGYKGIQSFRDIQLSQQATVDASGEGGGDIQVQGRRITLTNGSSIETSTLGSQPGGTLAVTATDSVKLSASFPAGPTGLFAQVYQGATGAGGNLTIEAEQLTVSGDKAGLSVGNYGEGNAGNLTIETGQLSVRDGSQVSASTFGAGKAGNLTIRASNSVELSGEGPRFPGGLFAQVDLTGKGAGGNLTIETGRLSVSEGSKVQVATFGEGDAGNLLIRASEVEVFNTPKPNVYLTGIFAGVQLDPRTIRPPRGNGGNLTIETERLRIRNGGKVDTSTYGIGNAGDSTIRASGSIEVVGVDQEGSRSLIAAPVYGGAVGKGGNLNIETRRLSVRDGGRVSVRTLGEGQGGDIRILADEIEVSGIGTYQDEIYPAEITAGVGGNSTSKGGSLRIEAEELSVKDEGVVSVSTEGSGDAGNLEIAAGSILLSDKGALRADTTAGQGNIFLRSGNLVLRRGSNITTNATGTATGGNITIDTGVMAALNSDISANADEASGGRVRISTQGIFRTPESDITASSNLGPEFSGTVEINTPDVDPSRGLVALPTEVVDASGLIAQGCPAEEGPTGSRFVVTGRGGLPPNPEESLSSDAVLTGLVTLDSDAKTRSGAVSSKPLPKSTSAILVSAKGWVMNDKGEVTLTAQVPTSVACDAP